MSRPRSTYGLYDLQDSECLVTMGSIQDIADYLETTVGCIRSGVCRKVKFRRRYEVVRLEDGE